MSIISIFQIITLKIINIASCQRIIITFTARPWTHLLLVHYLRLLVVDSITIIFFDSFDSMLLPSWGSSQLFSSEVYTIILLSPPPFITTRRLDVLNYDNVRASLYFSTLNARSFKAHYALGADLLGSKFWFNARKLPILHSQGPLLEKAPLNRCGPYVCVLAIWLYNTETR